MPFTAINSPSTTTGRTFTVTGLGPDTTHRFTVQAGDSANRWTGSGPNVVVRTGGD